MQACLRAGSGMGLEYVAAGSLSTASGLGERTQTLYSLFLTTRRKRGALWGQTVSVALPMSRESICARHPTVGGRGI